MAYVVFHGVGWPRGEGTCGLVLTTHRAAYHLSSVKNIMYTFKDLIVFIMIRLGVLKDEAA
jgi:hypothetical protein